MASSPLPLPRGRKDLLLQQPGHSLLGLLPVDVALPQQALRRLHRHVHLLLVQLHCGEKIPVLFQRLLHRLHCAGELQARQCQLLGRVVHRSDHHPTPIPGPGRGGQPGFPHRSLPSCFWHHTHQVWSRPTQGLCLCWSLCLAVCPSRYPQGWLLHLLQISARNITLLHPSYIPSPCFIISKHIPDITAYVHLLIYCLLPHIHTHTLECQPCAGGILWFVSLCVLRPTVVPPTEKALSKYLVN